MTREPKTVIVCVDGTWNGRPPAPSQKADLTNVARLDRLLGGFEQRQSIRYMEGVGTRRLSAMLPRGIWGTNSYRLVLYAYRRVCDAYRPGDRIALFGFSRGAFVVRELCHLIAAFGVMRPEHLPLINPDDSDARALQRIIDRLAFRRSSHLGGKPVAELIRGFRETYCHANAPDIAFVGLWDTVVMHGPIAPLLRHLPRCLWRSRVGLKARTLPACVRWVSHAMALDERRGAFPLTRVETDQTAESQVVEEMWFAGSHSDVGGGVKPTPLSRQPLDWMLSRAAAAGVAVRVDTPGFAAEPETLELSPDRQSLSMRAADVTRTDRHWLWRRLPMKPRVVEAGDEMHGSAEELMASSDYLPLADLPYLSR